MKFEFHYTYIIIAISFIITGYFSNLLIFTSIIIIHELGHYTIAKIIGLNPTKIIIYPFGGITKTVHPINTPIIKELVVSVSGIIFQLLLFLGSINSFKFSKKSILSPFRLIIKSFILITYFFKISRVNPKFKALEEIESMEKSGLVHI